MTFPEGCYLHKDRVWTCIAASKYDDDGCETADPGPINSRERDREWRFKNETLADEWAAEIGAEKATRIADCPRFINGWVVRLREPTDTWHEPVEVERWLPVVLRHRRQRLDASRGRSS